LLCIWQRSVSSGIWLRPEAALERINALFRQTEMYWRSREVSIMRVFGLELGTFRAIHRPEAPSFWAFWRLGRARAERGLSAQGDEPNKIGGIKPFGVDRMPARVLGADFVA